MLRKITLASFLFAVMAVTLDAANNDIDYSTARLARRLHAVKINEQISVDGVLDEPVWKTAPVASDFIQTEPREGEGATYRTEVRVLYDADMLYFGFMSYDSEPDKIFTNDIIRDFQPPDTDAIGIILDTFHDGRNGFEFWINPQGAKRDMQSMNESERNPEWEAVTYIKTRIIEEGWIAEIAIPFKTLRFPDASPQNWGINFARRVRRLNEDSFWSPIPRPYRLNRVSMAGTLEDLEGIQPGANIRVKPYVLSSFGQFAAAAGTRTEKKADAGFDLKYGLGASFIVDATLNTDFSQVEADEQQVNLTRFNLFFPEKREFFIENSGIFSFGTTDQLTGRQAPRNEELIFFFSRRIGIGDDGSEIPIFGGARLTGRLGPWSLGAVNIQTRKSNLAPATNFTVGRVRRNVGAGSQIGAIFINKDGIGFNRGYGADANLRFGSSTYFSSFYAKTDSTLGGLDNEAYRVAIAFHDRVWDIRSIFTDIGRDFNAEVGFVPRTGIRKWTNYFGYTFRPAALRRKVRDILPNIEQSGYWNSSNTIETKTLDFRLPINFQDGATFEAGRTGQFERLYRSFRIQTGVQIPTGDYWFDNNYVTYTSSRARPLGMNFRIDKGTFYSGNRTAFTLGGKVRPSFRLTTSVNYTRNQIDLERPDVRFNTDLASLRLNYSFTTTVFLNALIQYNTDARQWTSNIRFNIIHRPLSDLFIVYNERRDSTSHRLIDRALIGKLTYMFGY